MIILETEKKPNQQKGFTIVELSIVLTIIAVLVVAGLSGINTLITSNKAVTQIEDGTRVITKLQNFVSTGSSGVTTAAAKGMGLFPASRLTAAGVSNVFGGSELVVANNADLDGVSAKLGAIYTISGLPKQVCADVGAALATLAYSAWSSTGFTTEANTNAPTANQFKTKGGTINTAVLGTGCSGDTNNNGLSFLISP